MDHLTDARSPRVEKAQPIGAPGARHAEPMFNKIIVPTDGSDGAWRAVVFADRFARQCGSDVELLHVVDDPGDAPPIMRLLEHRLADEAIASEPPIVTLESRGRTVAETVAAHVASADGALLAMSSEGRGRTAAFLGSVTTDVLLATQGPVVVVGPDAKSDPPVGADFVVAVDGSDLSESILGLAGDWGIGLHARPWVVSVATGSPTPRDVFDSAYPSRLAHRLRALSGLPVEFEMLHGHHPAQAIADFATSIDATLILAGTHGRTGLARLAYGSVAAALVRHARCPVVLVRPPGLRS